MGLPNWFAVPDCRLAAPSKTPDVLWADAYLQTYFCLITELDVVRGNGTSLNLVISFDQRDTSRVPDPLLSTVAEAGESHPAVITFGPKPTRVMYESRPSDLGVREVHRRLAPLRDRYRIFWVPVRQRLDRRPHRDIPTVTLLPSNLGQGTCHLVVDVVAEPDLETLQNITSAAPLTFGSCHVISSGAAASSSKRPDEPSQEETQEDAAEGWTVVKRR